MTSKIDFVMNNVSKTAVMPINADSTVKRGTGSSVLVFGGLVVSQKGRPFEAMPITTDNYKDKLGGFIHSSKGKGADSMRSVSEALMGGNGVVVRVVPPKATYPAIKVSKPADSLVFTNEAIAYSADMALASGEFLALGIKDGAQSDLRKVTLDTADADVYGSGMFLLKLVEEQAAGGDKVLEEQIVSFDPEAKDAMGAPAYIETVLESKSKFLSCLCDPLVAKAEVTAIPETAFTGASNGNISDITTADYEAALKVLKASVLGFNYVCGLSIYDTSIIGKLAEMASQRRISGYYDVDPRLTFDEAEKFKASMGHNNYSSSFVHVPHLSKCPTFKNMCVWGASGVGFAAKARGVAKSAPIGGYHYTPAGSDRATIPRSGMKLPNGVGEPNYENMYKVRLNKLDTDGAGNLFIDDSLTSHSKEDYLRFEQVGSIFDAITRDFYMLGQSLKHQPDGVTEEELREGMEEILEGYEASGALVEPRDPENDGKEPWTLKIQQVEIDLWKVTWFACPTGSSRRLLGEPIVVR